MTKRNKLVLLHNNIFYNPILDEYLIQEDKKKKPIPLSACIEITHRCNFYCKHCSEVGAVSELDLKEISTITKKLVNGGVKRISVSGGEPLVRKDLISILEIIKKQGITITLSTNGYLLTEDKIRRIKKYVSNLRISLHGNAEFHDDFVGVKGAYKKVVNNIKLCVKHKIPVGIVCTAMQSNISQLLSLIKLANNLKVNKITFYTLFNRGRAKKIFKQESISTELVKQVLEQNRINNNSNGLCVKFVNWRSGRRKCLIIFPDGTLAASPFLRKKDGIYVLGNMRKNEFFELWEEFPFKESYFSKHFADDYF